MSNTWAKGGRLSDVPIMVSAYDKTVLRKGEGTLVLYLDSRVAFEGPHKLETLGIPVGGSAANQRSATGEAFREL